MNSPLLEIQTTALGLRIEQLTPHMGAIIHGIQLGEINSEKVIDYLKAMLNHHKVIFFRSQKLSTESFLDLAKKFGPIQIHPFNRSGTRNTPGVIRVYNHKENKSVINTWHTDASWREVTPYATFIRSLNCPKTGGDTMFANMEAAYQGLSEEMKNRIANLKAIHYITHFRNRMDAEGMPQEEIDAFHEKFSETDHPIIKVHPETGKKVLFVNEGYTIGIRDLPGEEGQKLLKTLCDTALIPEYQCRFKWEKNSVAIWDNRSTQHYPISDYWPATRLMERIVVSEVG